MRSAFLPLLMAAAALGRVPAAAQQVTFTVPPSDTFYQRWFNSLPRTDGSQWRGRKLGGNRATRQRRLAGFMAMR